LQFIDLARKAISAQISYINAIRELNNLSNEELNHLGISRLEIEYNARTSTIQRYKEEI
jgi:uncharacterized protein YjiS (DUF1127 family)